MTGSWVLVVDDEPKIRTVLRGYLEADGFLVREAADGEAALASVAADPPDLVILDVMLPSIDGIEVLRRLRTDSDVYVIMVTARAEEVDKLIGLAVGADDYVTKPFSPREVAARVRAVLRRSREGSSARNAAPVEQLHFAGLSVDLARREVCRDERPVTLSTLEFDLLAALAAAPGRVFSRRLLALTDAVAGVPEDTAPVLSLPHPVNTITKAATIAGAAATDHHDVLPTTSA